MPHASSTDRLLLDSALSSPHKVLLLEALLEWKAGTPLETALEGRGLGGARPLESLPAEQTVDHFPHTARNGEGGPTRGRYSKLRLHAKGGLGEVFVARDEELGREVALKEIQDHAADHPVARSRFVREAEVTGNLEHPGIVPVYGFGTYEDGRPYYAMRFIKGWPMEQAIKAYHQGGENARELRALLNHFVAACNAVGYAHSKGIIHRDIKPGNVMLGDYGETLLVDWGLARAKDEGLGSKDEGRRMKDEGSGLPPQGIDAPEGLSSDSSFILHPSSFPELTQEGAAMGTPAYMPPEQANGRSGEMGQTSDIFALGATLYGLLTGQAPYTGADALLKAAACAWRPAREVNQCVPRPLEAICARAMAKEPNHRYSTARELAQDVEQWLADEPVSAYREPAWDRVRRWGRRHRTLVTSGVVLLLVSVIGLVAGLGAVSAEQSRTANQRDRALRAEKEAKENLKAAEENLKLAKKAVNETFDLAKTDRLLNQPGMHQVRKLLLEKALPFYQQFQHRKEMDAQARAELADQYHRVGYITQEIGSKAEARRAFGEAEKIFRALAEEHPDVASYRDDLANTLINRGVLLQAEGKRGEARKLLTEASDIQETLAKSNPTEVSYRFEMARTRNMLGVLHSEEGRRDQALVAYTQAERALRALVKTSPSNAEYQDALAGTLTNMANLFKAHGQSDEGLKSYGQAREILRGLVQKNPTVTRYQTDLATTLNNIAWLHQGEGRRSEALLAYGQARDILEELAKTNPAVTRYRNDLAGAQLNLAVLFHEEGKLRQAQDSYTAAERIFEGLAKANPTVTRYRNALANAVAGTGTILRAEGKRSQALQAYTRSRQIGEKLVKEDPGVPRYQDDLARTLTNTGILLSEEGKQAEALLVYTQARDLQSKLAKDHPDAARYHAELATTLNNMAIILDGQGKRREALAVHAKARDIQEKLVKTNPSVTRYQNDLARTLLNIGNGLKENGDRAGALKAYTAARDLQEKLVKNAPTFARNRNDLAGTLGNIGIVLAEEGKWSEALKAYGKARDIQKALVKDNPTVNEYRNDLAGTLLNRSALHRRRKNPREALADLDDALVELLVVRKRDPRSEKANNLVMNTYFARATTLTALNRHADAATDWGNLLSLVPAENRPYFRLLRAESLARAGRASLAMREAESLARLPDLPGMVQYTLARIAALSAAARDVSRPLPEREHDSEACARKAVTWLRDAHRGRFFATKASRDHLAKDGDLDPLRNRDDFKQFLKNVTESP